MKLLIELSQTQVKEWLKEKSDWSKSNLYSTKMFLDLPFAAYRHVQNCNKCENGEIKLSKVELRQTCKFCKWKRTRCMNEEIVFTEKPQDEIKVLRIEN